jgi:RHH-type proline utilization regulon transcriptional repressor/proline dehydrogenase/delta 1-pyrroline-5-carboxylate dehydrogenase
MSPSDATAEFSPVYAEPDAPIAARLLEAHRKASRDAGAIQSTARDLVAAIRDERGGLGGVEDMLREFSLSTREGLALMVLAEALLRVPDALTADQLIEDKLAAGDFEHHAPRSDALLVNASAWALAVSARVIQPGERPEGIVGTLAKRLGLPAVRTAMRQAMRLMGQHFVYGESIEAALRRARDARRDERFSFDMLGEGARTAADAVRYFDAYATAIDALAAVASGVRMEARPGISVKLSALHPRYEAISHQRVLTELSPRLLELARAAKRGGLNLTVDAEEADRLELSLDVIAAAVTDPSLAGWDGFGIAVQAYQKRAEHVVEWFDGLANQLDRRFTLRLVKGAYWDTEIKRAQERGLEGYPVFTRKAMTDLNYLHCARLLLAKRERIFPQFATHNALTVASVLDAANGSGGYEFQRLHGMGDALYARLYARNPELACRVYAPVGAHADLLAYLVRRLLENGANTSFASAASDPDVPIERLLSDPAAEVQAHGASHPRLPLPGELYGTRKNSRGIEFGDRKSVERLMNEIRTETDRPIRPAGAAGRPIERPADGGILISVKEASLEDARKSVEQAHDAFPDWDMTPASARAVLLERAGDLIERDRARLIALLQAEGGKTLDDAFAEVREAADFCRYYAAEARRLFTDLALPGPAGERNVLRMRGRGVFVAISPWNFPLAIFTGQIAAALAAGNTVAAKPAEQTPLVAAEAVRVFQEAGIPEAALQWVQGGGEIGAALVAHRLTAGVVFTGSTEVARTINRILAGKDGPIVPLIAETGGINAMIVDATALPEQVADDAVTSAFRSAGQRCSALRLLFVQEEIAEKLLTMIAGAAAELKVGNPQELSTHIGPVIDAESRDRLLAHIERMTRTARIRFAGRAPADGTFVPPHLIELDDASALREEIFGPILHVVRYRADEIERVIDWIAASGYALTLGIHSRIEERAEAIAARLPAGNVYVNRNMIGAVVGVQPFGGSGLSGTGPKAGGPHYLPRFAIEQTLTVNTAAAGGDATLISLAE